MSARQPVRLMRCGAVRPFSSSQQPAGSEQQPPVQPPSLLNKFGQKLRADAQSLENMRKDPSAKNAHFLYRYDHELTERIKKLEAAELKRKEAGLSSKTGAFSQFMRSYFQVDTNKNERERQELLDLAFKKGRFDDLKEITKVGQKLWVAPEAMKPASACPAMPNISGKSLLGVETDLHTLIRPNKATLVAFFFNALGEPHVKSFTTPFLNAFPVASANAARTFASASSSDLAKEKKDAVSIVHMNVEEEWAKAWALGMFEGWIRRGVSADLRATYLLHRGSILAERSHIGMHNRLLGWVHLVDGAGRVRWSAHGFATDLEVQALISNTNRLLRE
ncbi:Mitochondrial ATPase complex subunit atp10 [Entophlyctis sp. JEL0112]|nr:Mitochondrial ATPase complex subunit atp10 [Entophlyctis sp. JEL0112]